MMDLSGLALRGLSAVLLVLPSLPGQGPKKPRFDKEHVVPFGSSSAGMLTKGQFVSVVGWHLTPDNWCGAPRTQQPPYPLALCGVRVIIGGHSAGLMYVGPVGNRVLNADQINFQVPANLKSEAHVPIQVCIATTCSDPVNVPFTNKDILLRVEQKAYVNMPLWVDFTIPFNNKFLYPISPCPWNFGGFQIEVRKEGRVLQSGAMPKCTDVDQAETWSAISVSRGLTRRLPVHLYHSFQVPGEYEVRMSGPILTPDLSKVSRIGYSDWIRVTVEPFSNPEREDFLDTVSKAVPTGDKRRHETELILSLLAQPDEKALKALMNFLQAPPPAASPARRIMTPRNMGRLSNYGVLRMNWSRDCLAPAALAAFPDAMLKKFIMPPQLEKLRATPAYCYWR